MAETNKFHPALTFNNVRNFIPITLEMEKGHYASWAELFKIHCRAYLVLEHIIPSTPPAPKDDLWPRLDAIVLQWIYGTISNDLLHTILAPESKAQKAWENLQNIFQDNQNVRATYLENQFSSVLLDNFSDVSAYCQELKMLADQLANVGSPVTNHCLVLQLIAGLNENFDTVATVLQQSAPLPSLYEARSRLVLEETRKAKQSAAATGGTNTAPITTNPSDDFNHPSRNTQSGIGRGQGRGNTQTRGQKSGRGSNSSRDRGRGGGRGRGTHNSGKQNGNDGQNNSSSGRGQMFPPWASYPPWMAPWASQWASQWVVPLAHIPQTTGSAHLHLLANLEYLELDPNKHITSRGLPQQTML